MTMEPENGVSWFEIEGFLRMRTNYKVTLDLDALILKPSVSEKEIGAFIDSIITGVQNERKI